MKKAIFIASLCLSVFIAVLFLFVFGLAKVSAAGDVYLSGSEAANKGLSNVYNTSILGQ